MCSQISTIILSNGFGKQVEEWGIKMIYPKGSALMGLGEGPLAKPSVSFTVISSPTQLLLIALQD